VRPVERHRLEEIVLPDVLDPETGDPIVTSRMVFVEIADEVDGAGVLKGKPTKTETAETLLAAMLADEEWHDSEGLKKLMGAAGHSARTVQRAAKYLGVESERRGFPSSTWWRIPLAGATALPVAPSLLAPSEPPKSGATNGTAQPCGSQPDLSPLAPSKEEEIALPTDAEVNDWLALADGLDTEPTFLDHHDEEVA
jgi:hypothetical protein